MTAHVAASDTMMPLSAWVLLNAYEQALALALVGLRHASELRVRARGGLPSAVVVNANALNFAMAGAKLGQARSENTARPALRDELALLQKLYLDVGPRCMDLLKNYMPRGTYADWHSKPSADGLFMCNNSDYNGDCHWYSIKDSATSLWGAVMVRGYVPHGTVSMFMFQAVTLCSDPGAAACVEQALEHEVLCALDAEVWRVVAAMAPGAARGVRAALSSQSCNCETVSCAAPLLAPRLNDGRVSGLFDCFVFQVRAAVRSLVLRASELGGDAPEVATGDAISAAVLAPRRGGSLSLCWSYYFEAPTVRGFEARNWCAHQAYPVSAHQLREVVLSESQLLAHWSGATSSVYWEHIHCVPVHSLREEPPHLLTKLWLSVHREGAASEHAPSGAYSDCAQWQLHRHLDYRQWGSAADLWMIVHEAVASLFLPKLQIKPLSAFAERERLDTAYTNRVLAEALDPLDVASSYCGRTIVALPGGRAPVATALGYALVATDASRDLPIARSGTEFHLAPLYRRRLARTGAPSGAIVWPVVDRREVEFGEQVHAPDGVPVVYLNDAHFPGSLMWHRAEVKLHRDCCGTADGTWDVFLKAIRARDLVVYRHYLRPTQFHVSEQAPADEHMRLLYFDGCPLEERLLPQWSGGEAELAYTEAMHRSDAEWRVARARAGAPPTDERSVALSRLYENMLAQQKDERTTSRGTDDAEPCAGGRALAGALTQHWLANDRVAVGVLDGTPLQCDTLPASAAEAAGVSPTSEQRAGVARARTAAAVAVVFRMLAIAASMGRVLYGEENAVAAKAPLPSWAAQQLTKVERGVCAMCHAPSLVGSDAACDGPWRLQLTLVRLASTLCADVLLFVDMHAACPDPKAKMRVAMKQRYQVRRTLAPHEAPSPHRPLCPRRTCSRAGWWTASSATTASARRRTQDSWRWTGGSTPSRARAGSRSSPRPPTRRARTPSAPPSGPPQRASGASARSSRGRRASRPTPSARRNS